MKKSLSLLLAIALVFGMFSNLAFAAEKSAGELLNEVGVILGNGTDLKEDQTWKRQDVAVLLSRLYGAEAEAKATAKNHGFADVTDKNYDGFITWAKNEGLLVGKSATAFGYGQEMKAQEFAAVILRVLKIDVPYADATAEAVKAGILPAGTENATMIKRGATYEGIVAALNKEVDGEKLGTSLGLGGPWAVAPVAAVKIDSAVSVNSKIVEVTLSEKAEAVSASQFTVADKDGKAVGVASAELAAWDGDKKTVLLTLAADTTSGQLYSVKVGDKSVNFGGRAKDETKPGAPAVVADWTAVKLTFGEHVLANAKFAIAEKYGTKAALALSAVKYDGAGNKLELTTEAQKAVLYEVTVTGLTDLAGNVADEFKFTFVGVPANTAKQTVVSATATDSKTVEVTFNIDVDKASAAVAANYAIAEKYGSKTAVVVSKAETTDNAKVVKLTLATDTTKNTLYEVTINNVSTKYGVAMDGTQKTTFVGQAKDESKLALNATPVNVNSNTEIELVFDDNVDKDSVTAAMITVAEKYGDKAALTFSIKEVKNNKITLTTAAQKAVLYEVKLAKGLKDDNGNVTDAELVTTFVGVKVADKISDITSATLNGDGTELTVVFNKNVASNANDVALYFIDGGVGYPAKAVKSAANTVKLTLPKTQDGKVYTLTVKGLANSDGIAMDAAGITEKFVGKGVAATAPQLVAAIATDKQTLEIHFDRDVTDASIKGASKVWNGNALVAGALSYVHNANVTTDLEGLTEYAYQHATNKNVLVVRFNAAAFDAAKKETTLGAFKLVGSVVFHVDHRNLIFAPNDSDVAKINIEAVMALNSTTIRVFFDQPVTGNFTNWASIDADDAYDVAEIVTSNPVAIDSTKKVYDFKLSSALSAATAYYLTVNPAIAAANVGDLAGFVTIADKNDTAANIQHAVQFAGSGDAAGDINEVSVIMTDKKTIVIYYPEIMNSSAAVANNTASASALDVDNYTVVTTNGGTTPVNMVGGGTFDGSTHIASATYESSNNTVKLVLNTALDVTGSAYLQINKLTANAVGTKVVQKDSAAITPQLAVSTEAAAKVTVTEVTYAAATSAITVKLSQDIQENIATEGDFVAAFAVTVLSNTGVANELDATEIATFTRVSASEYRITLENTVNVGAQYTGSVKFQTAAAITGINGEVEDQDTNKIFAQQ